ncbi:MAG: pyridoxamine 5'-phosphate oxidase family protein [Desulfonatronovibrio sp.]
MLKTIKEIIRANDLAVLATSAENTPYCSLMAYVSGDGGLKIYMLTRKDSRKFRNINANPQVCLMVDTRADKQGDRQSIKALTISGTCFPAHSSEQDPLLDLLIRTHPQLKTLAEYSDAVVMQVAAESFLLLDGVNDAFFVDLTQV